MLIQATIKRNELTDFSKCLVGCKDFNEMETKVINDKVHQQCVHVLIYK